MTPSIADRRLANQHLVGSGSRTPAEAVARLAAVQAQDYAGAKWALGMRLRRGSDADVERAFNAGAILRTHVLRPTWHFVTPADIRWLLALTAPRLQASNAYMYRRANLDAAILRRSQTVLTRALRGQPRTRDDLRGILQKSGVPTEGELRMGYLLMHAELEGLICSGPRQGRQFTYALLDDRAPRTRMLTRDESLVELARRFFTSRGPATVHDLAKWSGLTVADGRRGLEGVQTTLANEVVDGRELWSVPSRTRVQGAAAPTAHLLSIYDEYVSGYKDRGDVITAPHAARLSAMTDAIKHPVLVNGHIVGAWTRRLDGDAVAVTIDVYAKLTRAEARGVQTAFEAYRAFVGTEVRLDR